MQKSRANEERDFLSPLALCVWCQRQLVGKFLAESWHAREKKSGTFLPFDRKSLVRYRVLEKWNDGLLCHTE